MITRISRLKRLSLILLALVLPSAATHAASDQPPGAYRFGIVPQQSATTLAKTWVPIFRYLSDRTGLELQFHTARDIPNFESRVAAGEYDFAYMNPYHYVTYHEVPGYEAFANQSQKKIRGIMVRARGASITSLQDLSGRTLAFPSPAAFAASLLPRGALKQAGVEITPKYVGSHDSVYRAVAKGLFPAGGGIERTFFSLSPEVRDRLEVWWTSAGFTPHAFAAHPRVPQDIVDRLTLAMVEMQHDPQGAKLLERIKFKGIQRAVDAAWDDVRALQLTPEQAAVNNKSP